MRTASKRIAGAFQLIGEVLDELSHAEKVWLACGWGDSVPNTISFSAHWRMSPHKGECVRCGDGADDKRVTI